MDRTGQGGYTPVKMPIKRYELIWSPEGKVIGEVDATSPRHAIKMTPAPYNRFKAEVYAREKGNIRK